MVDWSMIADCPMVQYMILLSSMATGFTWLDRVMALAYRRVRLG